MKHTKFQSMWLAGALCLGLLGAGATVASAHEGNAQNSDGGGAQLSDITGIQISDITGTTLTILDVPTTGGAAGMSGLSNAFTQNPQGFSSNFASSLGHFGVSAQSLVTALELECSSSPDKSACGQASNVRGSLNRVATTGQRFQEILAQLVNSEGQVNPVVLGSAISAARSFRAALSKAVQDLKKVPAKSLTPQSLSALNMTVDDLSNLTASLETVAPVLSELSKRANGTAMTSPAAAGAATSGKK